MSFSEILYVSSAALTSLGGGALIVFGFSSWLGKIWAERILAGTRATHEAALERLRAEIRREGFERETRFSRLAEKQAEVLAEFYSRLVEFYDSGREFLFGGFHVDAEHHTRFVTAACSFKEYLDRNEIYLSSSLCERLTAFQDRVSQTATTKFLYQSFRVNSDADKKEFHDKIMELWGFVTDTMPALKKQIADEFRSLLGVKETT